MQLVSHAGSLISLKVFIPTKRRNYESTARTSRPEASLFWIKKLNRDKRNEHVVGHWMLIGILRKKAQPLPPLFFYLTMDSESTAKGTLGTNSRFYIATAVLPQSITTWSTISSQYFYKW